MKRVLLTGATGFIGRHFLERLAADRDVELHAVNRSGKGPIGAAWHAANLTEPDEAGAVVLKVRPTHILHGAWDVTPGRFWRDPSNADWEIAGLALIAAATTVKARFVGVGTCAEYDWSHSLLSEDETPIVPATRYGIAKANVWRAAIEGSRAPAGLSAAWGRVFIPYGPGDNPQRLFPSAVSALRDNRAIELTSGIQERDFVHVSDIADQFVRMLLSDVQGAFNVASGSTISVRAAVEMLADAMGADRSLLRFGARPDRDEPRRLAADMTKTLAKLNFRPAITLAQGLRTIAEAA